MGEEKKLYKLFVGKPEERDHLEDRGVDRNMGLEWLLGRFAGSRVWSGFS
jgi:hypothetical protein